MTMKSATQFKPHVIFGSILLLITVGCAGPTVCGFKQKDLEQSFAPLPDYTIRPPVNCEHVLLFDKAPVDRKFKEIGIVVPRSSHHHWADAVQAARATAALKGADAVYLISDQIVGGSHRLVRAMAIVWTDR